MLERAVSQDPGYPPAWLALGRRYYVEARYIGVDASRMTRYDTALERALSLEPNYVAAGTGRIVSRVAENSSARIGAPSIWSAGAGTHAEAQLQIRVPEIWRSIS